MIKVLELKGVKSLTALNAFSTLMLGLKMLPMYLEEGYVEFYERITQMPLADQETMIREALVFVNLRSDEVEALLSFCADANGVAYQTANIKNLGPNEIIDMAVAVCLKIAEIKINFISETEKKNLKISQSKLDTSTQKIQH